MKRGFTINWHSIHQLRVIDYPDTELSVRTGTKILSRRHPFGPLKQDLERIYGVLLPHTFYLCVEQAHARTFGRAGHTSKLDIGRRAARIFKPRWKIRADLPKHTKTAEESQ